MRNSILATLAEKLEGLTCPNCGHENTYTIRQIDKTLRVGHDTVTVQVIAGVCSYCGEEALDDAATAAIDDAIQAVRQHDVRHLTRVGDAYTYP
jgi:YgiT-type zinc finger domain-containing protein